MISTFEEGGKYPREDKCKYCGDHIGWILHPLAEAMALEVCEKPECLKKKQEEASTDVGS